MNIPGKLREDLKRIYGADDPMNYIEDIKAETNPDTCQGELIVRLRVPRPYERYIPEVYITSASPFTLDHWALQRAKMMDLLSSPLRDPKPVEWKTGKALPVEMVKPSRVIFSGPMTHVFWPDGSKTTVRLAEGQEHDEYIAFCCAVVKKLFDGSTPRVKKFLDKVKIVQKKKVKKSKAEDAL